MPLEIHAESHLDHALTPAHVSWLLKEFEGKQGFFIASLEIPADLGPLPCGLYGPLVGDPPVPEAEVTYAARGTRTWPSRLSRFAIRESRMVTVIAGPHDGRACVLFTAYGGPLAPREPGDPSLKGDELEEAQAFWKNHALAT